MAETPDPEVYVRCVCCGLEGMTPAENAGDSFDEGFCRYCGGDPKAKSVRKRLGWAYCAFFDARIPIVGQALSESNRRKWRKMSYSKKCDFIGKMIEKGAMI